MERWCYGGGAERNTTGLFCFLSVFHTRSCFVLTTCCYLRTTVAAPSFTLQDNNTKLTYYHASKQICQFDDCTKLTLISGHKRNIFPIFTPFEAFSCSSSSSTLVTKNQFYFFCFCLTKDTIFPRVKIFKNKWKLKNDLTNLTTLLHVCQVCVAISQVSDVITWNPRTPAFTLQMHKVFVAWLSRTSPGLVWTSDK